jgi:hypothetical protein
MYLKSLTLDIQLLLLRFIFHKNSLFLMNDNIYFNYLRFELCSV